MPTPPWLSIIRYAHTTGALLGLTGRGKLHVFAQCKSDRPVDQLCTSVIGRGIVACRIRYDIRQLLNVSSVSQACRKRRLNGSDSRNCRIKRLAPCRYFDGHFKEPYKMSMALGARPGYNFFFSPPAHLCRHIYDWNIVACDVQQPI